MQLRQRLTYANVMSSLAVFLVLGGATAFAATKIGANQLKANAVRTGKIQKEAVTAAKIRNEAVTGAKANEATFGQVPSAAIAETAAPRAYARVVNAKAGLAVDPARSKGLGPASVTFVGGSVYCFELGFAVRNVQATVDWIDGGKNTFAQATVEPFGSCPSGTDASVRTTNNEGEGIDSINFYVAFVG